MNRKHYTKHRFADALVSFIPTTPTRILEPCCGDGSLMRAAAKAWPEAILAGFERGRRAAAAAKKAVPTATVNICDALCTRWLVRGRRPSLVICNPPFGGESRQSHNSRTDFKFFAKALAAIDRGGVALLVLPFSVTANPSFQEWRRAVLHGYSLLTAVQLPHNAFEDTDAAAVALILAESGVDQTRFIQLNSKGEVEKEVTCAVDESQRVDPHYYISHAALPLGKTATRPLAELVTSVRRGHFIPPDRRGTRGHSRQAIVGLAELAGAPLRRFCRDLVEANTRRGDVLISRVGRRAGLDVLFLRNDAETVVANDCAYIVTPKRFAGYLAAALLTGFVRAQLLARRRGMATRVLSKADLLDVRIPLLGRQRMATFSQRWRRNPDSREALLAELNNAVSLPTAP